MAERTKVFISYSHDSPEHAKRVLDLADALRHGGLEVILDQYVFPAPDEGWPRWMDTRLDEANFVLVVCTETYRRRVMDREEPGKGLGVRWEGSLIYNRIYNDKPSGSRFIPVLLEGGDPAQIPNPVQGHTYYRIGHLDLSDAGYQGLYRHLTGQAPTPPSEIGAIQTLPPSPRWTPSALDRSKMLKVDQMPIFVISTIAQFINRSLSRVQQEETEKQRRADRYGPEEGALQREASDMRIHEERYRITLQQRVALGADPLSPGTWWDSRRPSGSGPLVVVDIGPRTAPAALNLLEFLVRSLKKVYASGSGPQPDVIHDCLCLDNEGTARGFHYTELRGHPAILVYGKPAGNHVYIDAVFSRLLYDATSPGELEWENLGTFPCSLCADLAKELKLADPTRVQELFDVLCDMAVNTKLLNLLDIHFGLRDDAYTPQAHTFFFRRRQDLIDRGLWPEGNKDLREVEQVMEDYPVRIERLRLEAANLHPPYTQCNIAILGTSGSGKTSFLYAMYDAFRQGVAGVLLNMKDLEWDLRLRKCWQKICQGIFPPPNDQNPVRYTFRFREGLNVLMDFDWVDYRGGALRDRSDATDVKFIRDYLKISDCIFLCISGEHLQHPITDRCGDVAEAADIDRMSLFLYNLQPVPPLVILITKAELIRHRSRDDILYEIKALFGLFFRIEKQLIMVCPVSIIPPTNLELPLIFAIQIALGRKIDEAMLNDRRRAQELEELWTKLRPHIERLRWAPIFCGSRKVELDHGWAYNVESIESIVARFRAAEGAGSSAPGRP